MPRKAFRVAHEVLSVAQAIGYCMPRETLWVLDRAEPVGAAPQMAPLHVIVVGGQDLSEQPGDLRGAPR